MMVPLLVSVTPLVNCSVCPGGIVRTLPYGTVELAVSVQMFSDSWIAFGI